MPGKKKSWWERAKGMSFLTGSLIGLASGLLVTAIGVCIVLWRAAYTPEVVSGDGMAEKILGALEGDQFPESFSHCGGDDDRRFYCRLV